MRPPLSHLTYRSVDVRRMALVIVAAFSIGGAPIKSAAQAAPSVCGELANAFGPFDYRTVRGQELRLVEGAHFTAIVEAVIRGTTSETPGGDIDYTLRAFPNHHRALIAAIRLGDKAKSTQPHGMRYSIECWLERAVRFRDDDTTARMIFAGYLAKHGKADVARSHLAIATRVAGENPFTHYNIGLMYLELADYEAALRQAKRAEELGFTRTELREALVKAGKWVDSGGPSSSASMPSPAATASEPSR